MDQSTTLKKEKKKRKKEEKEEKGSKLLIGSKKQNVWLACQGIVKISGGIFEEFEESGSGARYDDI